jgi:cell division protein ZapA (FtsZ GTPase activity inhibitor)
MSPEKFEPVTVRIAGEEHTIRANVAPEYTRKCARLVDERIYEIRSKSQLVDGHRAAILAALSIAGDYFQSMDETERVRKETAKRVSKLVKKLEDSLEIDSPKPAKRAKK